MTNAKLLQIWDHDCVRQRSDLAATLKDVPSELLHCAAHATNMGQCFDLLRWMLPTQEYLIKDVADFYYDHEAALTSSTPSPGTRTESTAAPRVYYAHEPWRCQVPPGNILLPGILSARLLWGGLSPVLNKMWLRWAGVTHVLNCLGSTRGSSDEVIPDPNHALAMQARSDDDNIQYIDWCIAHVPSRRAYLSTFAHLESVLNTPTACLYVHCKSGQDRSPLTIFALLRLRFHVRISFCWRLLPALCIPRTQGAQSGGIAWSWIHNTCPGHKCIVARNYSQRPKPDVEGIGKPSTWCPAARMVFQVCRGLVVQFPGCEGIGGTRV